MGSNYGKDRNMVCPGCGMSYDYDARDKPSGFTIAMTFATARRDIIAIGVDRKTGKTKYGRRNGTLGFLHELKKLAWAAHVDQCVDGFDAAVAQGADPESMRLQLAEDRKRAPRKPRNRRKQS